MKTVNISIYRYNPDVDDAPYMKDYSLEIEESGFDGAGSFD